MLHVVLLCACLGLILLAYAKHPTAKTLQRLGSEFVEPFIHSASRAIEPVRSLAVFGAGAAPGERIDELQRQVARLKMWQRKAKDLEKQVRELRRLSNVTRILEVEHVVAPVLTRSQGRFGKTVTVAAGSTAGIRTGQPVSDHDGWAGRIVSVTPSTARVLLLNDRNSRISVEIGERRVRALAVGDNSSQLHVLQLSPDAPIASGDRVVSSDATGEMPRGLSLGQIVRTTAGWRIKPDSKLAPDGYLAVLDYRLRANRRQHDERAAMKSGAQKDRPMMARGQPSTMAGNDDARVLVPIRNADRYRSDNSDCCTVGGRSPN